MPIADAVSELFHDLANRLREVQLLLSRLPWDFEEPAALPKLHSALEQCLRNTRQTRLTVQAVMRNLDALRDGLTTLQALEVEVRDTTVEALRDAHTVVTHMASQLEGLGIQATNVEAAAARALEPRGQRRLPSSAPCIWGESSGPTRCPPPQRRRCLQINAASAVVVRANGVSFEDAS